MSDLLYIGLVVAGAITLVIEAYRNFNSTSGRHPFELHPILREVEVRNLCTTSEIVVGFAFYAFLYLVVYAVLLSSAEVYGLLVQANNALQEIGATDTEAGFVDPTVKDVISFSSGNYNKPFIVSALIISSLSLGAVKPIETTMRFLAHRLAGVPHGVYKVITILRNIPYSNVMKGHPKPLAAIFTAQMRRGDMESDSSDGEQNQPEIPVYWQERILDTLRSIDCLRLATDPNGRTLYFPLYDLERLNALSKRIETQYADLKKTISELSANPSPTEGDQQNAQPVYSEEKYAKLASDANTLSANMMAYFAVLFIRNNRAIFGLRNSNMQGEKEKKRLQDPIAAIKKQIHVPDKDEHNAFALSICIALVISSPLVLFLYYCWRYWVGEADPTFYTPFLVDKDAVIAAVNQCQPEYQLVCDDAIKRWLRAEFGELLKWTTWDQIQSVAVTFMSVLLVIIGRDMRIEEQSWRTGWTFGHFPFLRFLSMSVLSGVAAFFMTAIVKAGSSWWDADFQLTEIQIIVLFRDQGSFYILQAGSGIILGITALTIMDGHSGLKKRWTLITAAVGGVAFYFYQWAVLFASLPFPTQPGDAYFSQNTRDALIYSALPVCFLLIFAAVLEFGETADNAKGGGDGRDGTPPDSPPSPMPVANHGRTQQAGSSKNAVADGQKITSAKNRKAGNAGGVLEEKPK